MGGDETACLEMGTVDERKWAWLLAWSGEDIECSGRLRNIEGENESLLFEDFSLASGDRKPGSNEP